MIDAEAREFGIPAFVHEILFQAWQRTGVDVGVGREIRCQDDVALQVGMPKPKPDILPVERVLPVVDLLPHDGVEIPANGFPVVADFAMGLFGFIRFLDRFRQHQPPRDPGWDRGVVGLPHIAGDLRVVGAEKLDRLDVDARGNAGETPCRILEIIAPGGCEGMFDEMGALTDPPTIDDVRAPNATYGLGEEFESVGRLCERFGPVFPT